MSIESQANWNSFLAEFSGDVSLPQSAEYDDARTIWNAAFDRCPLAVLRPATVQDVAAAVRFAREADLPTAVRSGGHSYPGHSTCDDGVIIDLSRLRAIDMDLARGSVRAGAGVLLGEVDRATLEFGQVVPAGIVSHTGLAGLALGGGIGYLTRSFGLTCDQFIQLEVVTADGEIVYASEDENPDLLWGLRGGGGNFGIVTEFELRTHSLGEFYAGHLLYRISEIETAAAIAGMVERGPRDLSAFLTFGMDPRTFGLEIADAEPLFGAMVVYRGAEDDEPLRELRSVGNPVLDTVGPIPFADWQSQLDVRSGPGVGWYMKSKHTQKMTEPLLQKMADVSVAYRDVAAPGMIDRGVFSFQPIGGAAADVSEDDSAYSGRRAQWHTAIEVGFNTPDDGARLSEWVRERWSEIEPLHDLSTSYVNMMVDERAESVEDVYGAHKLERLRRVKVQYDPTNFFRLNSNIAPETERV
jgi:FAD/FMN-containing dehydrogenase